MDEAGTNAVEFAEALGLQPEAGGLFVGKIRGFPVGLQIILSEAAAVFLFQIRHWLTEQAARARSLVYDSVVNRLMTEKAIEIELEDRMAWLTVNKPEQCLEIAPLSQIVDSVLNSFAQAGLIGDAGLCHYCQKNRTDSLTVSNGKVAQICQSCLKERMAGPRAEAMIAGAESVPVALLTPIAALVGALLWAGCWIGYDMVLSGADDVVMVPRLVVAIAMVVVGLMVGGPVGWIIKKNRRRGSVASAVTAILYSSAAVAMGELLSVVWLIYREYDVVSFSAAIQVMPAFYHDGGGFYLGMKAFAAVVGLLLAFEMAKPERSGLKL